MNSSNFLFWAVYPSEVCIMTMHLHYIYDSAGSEKKKNNFQQQLIELKFISTT